MGNNVGHPLQQLLVLTCPVVHHARGPEVKVCPEWSNKWDGEGGEEGQVVGTEPPKRYETVGRNLEEEEVGGIGVSSSWGTLRLSLIHI